MKKSRITKLLSYALAFVLAVTPVLTGLPPMEAQAATTVNWRQIRSGSAVGESLVLHDTARMTDDGTFSVTYKKKGNNLNRQNIGIYYKYFDEDNWLYVGTKPEEGQWYYSYRIGGVSKAEDLTLLPYNRGGEAMEVSLTMSRETFSVTVNGVEKLVTDQKFFDLVKAGEQAKVGLGVWTSNISGGLYTSQLVFKDAKLNGTALADTWSFKDEKTGAANEPYPVYMCDVTGIVQDAQGRPLANARVRVGSANTLTGADGKFTLSQIEQGDYTLAASCAGYTPKTVSLSLTDADVQVPAIALTAKAEPVLDPYTISTDVLKATVSKTFPQVYGYELKMGNAWKKIEGQTEALSAITINGTSITPVIEDVIHGPDNVSYQMTLKKGEIDLTMTVKISVAKNNLTWEATEIKKGAGCPKINTINVPNLNLVTLTDSGANSDAQFMGAKISGNTKQSGDREITFANGLTINTSSGYAYGFLSMNGISAGLWSNSERENDERLTLNTAIDKMALTSAPWYYDYNDESGFTFSIYDNVYDGQLSNGIPASDLPSVKVCLTGDKNQDGIADWQDGAIAYRDIMNNPYGSENTKDLVNYRIIMNFSSQAANPFLKTADNIKKVYLATDGLPQAVMMKGFGSEGHDSANSEYGNVGERIGGIEDLKKLNVIAHQYNTQTGIHINAQEAYPEAQSFTDSLINGSSSKGWGWLDQSYTINRAYDLGSGLRYKRLLQLYDQLNGTSLYANKWPGVVGKGGANETVASQEMIAQTVKENLNSPTDLDFMYLDVWYGNSWETRKIAKQFNSLGWRFSTEFGYEGEYDSTWQHWATEGHYGGAGMKGLNSDVIRFIRNHQKDSFVLNWPSFGGAADNPLLGGYDLSGFEGWGGSNYNFDTYMTRTFAVNLPTKFLQHYKVYKWENYPGNQSPTENHEKKITLKSDDGTQTVVVERNPRQRQDGYTERIITLNGKKILEDVSYLLPWIDSETKEVKLYHYNYDGGTTSWALPDGWGNLANVRIYRLTDAGRTDGKVVPVVNGQITLAAAANTPYVVIKGTASTAAKTVTNWSEHMHVADAGFNSYAGTGSGDALDASIWKGSAADVRVVRVQSGNKYLRMGSRAAKQSVSTAITGLEAGKDYVAQIYVDNKSDAKAWIKVTGGEKSVSNYTLRSLAQNYVQCDAHNIRGVSDSRMQLMLVSFKAKSDKATLALEREPGEGYTYFDDIRIIQKKLDNIKADGSFVQDFESVTGGLYPFVLGPSQGVTDHVTHLSEKHEPYTQSGWGNVYIDDVIGGKWSLKHHGNNPGLLYRTIPQNLHFEPGVLYDISFDYQAAPANKYFVVAYDGDTLTFNGSESSDTNNRYLQSTTAGSGQKSTTQQYTFSLTGAGSGQSWFGIYTANTSVSGDTGYGASDLVIDNLRVVRRGVSLTPADVKTKTAKDPIELEVRFDDELDKDNAVTWSTSKPEAVKLVPNPTDSRKCTAYFVGYGTDGTAVVSAATTMNMTPVTLTSNFSLERYYELSGQENKKAGFKGVFANTESTGDGDVKTKAIDGNAGSQWHSNWSAGFVVSTSNPAKLTVQIADEDNISNYNRLNIMQRASNSNGLVQKYKVVIGDEFNEAAHAITGTEGTTMFTSDVITAKKTGNGETEQWMLPNGAKGKYLQIQVLQGGGGHASIAEVDLDKMGIIDAEAENGYISANASGFADKAKEALSAALAEAEKVKNKGQGSYSAASWEAFEAAYTAADTGKDTASADFMALQQELSAAQSALMPEQATAQQSLTQAVAAEAGMVQGSYTTESWTAYQTALTAAGNATASYSAAQLVRLKKALELAKANLVTAADQEKADARDALNAALAEAKRIVDGGQGDYTAGTWGAFSSKYTAAQEGAAAEAATAEALRLMQEELESAQFGLETKVQAARKLLSTELAKAKKKIDMGQERWSNATWQHYTGTYNSALAALNEENATEAGLLGWQGKLAQAESSLAETTAPEPPQDTPTTPTDQNQNQNQNQSQTQPAVKDGDPFTAEDGAECAVISGSDKTAKLVKGKDSRKISVNVVKLKGVEYKVVEIGDGAFTNCKKLTEVSLGADVEKIGKNAFKGCKKLKNVKIANKSKLKTVHKTAFKSCAKGISTKLPKSLAKNAKLKAQLKKAGLKVK